MNNIKKLFVKKLINKYHYPEKSIKTNYDLTKNKIADIVILNNNNEVYCIILINDKKENLQHYVNIKNFPIIVWTNGKQIDYYQRIDNNYLEPLKELPKFNETINDVKDKSITHPELVKNDKISKENVSITDILNDIENNILVLPHVSIFEEILKLLFIKIFDEIKSIQNKFRELQFKTYSNYDKTQKVVNELFEEAKKYNDKIFVYDDVIQITNKYNLQICVAHLEKIRLFDMDLKTIHNLRQYLFSKIIYKCLPYDIINLVNKIISPKQNEYVYDMASGDFSFCNNRKNLFTNNDEEYVFRINAFINMTIRPIDDQLKLIELNPLDYQQYNYRFRKHFSKLSETYLMWKKNRSKYYDKFFNLVNNSRFDVVITNPLYNGQIKNSKLLREYNLSKSKNKMLREVLLLEKSLKVLKEGGRLAIILSDFVLNDEEYKKVRQFILEKTKIISIIGLNKNYFGNYILILQKQTKKITENDYPIYLSTPLFKNQNYNLENVYSSFNMWAKKNNKNFYRKNIKNINNENNVGFQKTMIQLENIGNFDIKLLHPNYILVKLKELIVKNNDEIVKKIENMV